MGFPASEPAGFASYAPLNLCPAEPTYPIERIAAPGTEGVLDTRELASRLAKGDRRAVAKAITLVENEGAGAAGLVAYSAICTHLGCAVNEKLNRDGLILCPCHGSIYDPANHAAVHRGPSDRALPGISIADGPNSTVVANGLFDGPIGPQ